MAVDKLQDRIRKLKSPLVLDLTICADVIPPHILNVAGKPTDAYKLYAKSLLQGLSGVVAAVRFTFGNFAVLGADGLIALEEISAAAREAGYYVLMDGVEAFCAEKAELAASALMSKDSPWSFDGIILDSYIGSDGLRPYTARLAECDKDLFVVVRTANRSASEIQDLLSGSRLVHAAKTDIVNRFSGDLMLRNGYSRVGIMAAASSPDSIRTLRSKYKNMFILLDGSDYPNSNAKNCSFAFDQLGHGAVACIGRSVTAAWLESDEENGYLELAVAAAERMKKNIARYVTIL